MTHLDAIAQAIGYAMMVAGGIWCVSKLLSVSAWALFENIKSNGRLIDYMLWRGKKRGQE